MKTLARLAVAATAAVVLCGCGDKAAEPPKQYAPPPTVGSKGALRGGQAPTPPIAPK